MRPVGRHGIGAGYGTQGNRVLVGAFVAHNAYTADCRQQNGTSLPYFIVENFAVFANVVLHVLDVNVVSILQNAYLFAGNIAKNAHCQAWSGEWVALDEAFGHAQFVPYTAHFVFEKPL